MGARFDKFEAGVEKIFGLLGAICFWAAFAYYYRDHKVPATFGALASATVDVSAIAVGFIATAKSILIGAPDQWIVKKLREVGKFAPVMKYCMSAIWWCFASTVASGCCVYFDVGANDKAWVGAWFFVTGGAVFSCIRAIRIFGSVLRQFR